MRPACGAARHRAPAHQRQRFQREEEMNYPSMAVLLPIVVIFQSTITVPIPNTPALAGQEFYAQGIALPWLNMPQAPAYQLPRGGRIYIQP